MSFLTSLHVAVLLVLLCSRPRKALYGKRHTNKDSDDDDDDDDDLPLLR